MKLNFEHCMFTKKGVWRAFSPSMNFIFRSHLRLNDHIYIIILVILLRQLNDDQGMFKLLKKRYCNARRRQRYINRNGK